MSGSAHAAANAVTVRRGDERDRRFIVDLGRRSAGSSVSEVRPAPATLVASSFDRLVDFVFDAAHVVLVAEDALAPLGFLLLLTDMPDEVTSLPQAFVAYMAVEPHAMRRGIGKTLLEAAEDEARALGLSHLSLMVTEANAEARELYAQAGFATERRLLCKAL